MNDKYTQYRLNLILQYNFRKFFPDGELTIATEYDNCFKLTLRDDGFCEVLLVVADEHEYLKGGFEHYFLSKTDWSTLSCPILLCRIDDQSETVMCGFCVKLEKGRIEIPTRVDYRTLSAETAIGFLAEIKKMFEISLVSAQTAYVVKSIIVQPKGRNMPECKYVYLRPLSHTYKMNTPNLKELTYIQRFERNLRGTPQDEYPSDILDDLILRAIEKHCGYAKLENSLFITSDQVRKLRLMLNMHCIKQQIALFPEINMQNAAIWNGYEPQLIPIRLYGRWKDFEMNAIPRVLSVQIPENGFMKYNMDISRLTPTMHFVEEYITPYSN